MIDPDRSGSGATRRQLLRAGAVAAGGLALGPTAAGASPSTDRYIVDTSTTSMAAMGDVEMVHDLRDRIDYAVVRAAASELPDDASYVPDVRVQVEEPVERRSVGSLEGADGDGDPLTPLQWDKAEQDLDRVREEVTGDGARIGIIDSGVLGAGDEGAHPDLPNVLGGPSYNFTGDGDGPGPNVDKEFSAHGTEVAGTAAAAANGAGVVGVAPAADVVDLRVFSGEFATTGDIVAAIVVGATPVDEEVTVTVGNAEEVDERSRTVSGSGCDVLNLSLGTPPFVPLERLRGENTPTFDEDLLPSPLLAADPAVVASFERVYGRAASYARANGALPVASAGNSGVGLGIPVSDDRQPPFDASDAELDPADVDAAPVTVPANAPGFLTVGATGPIGFGWPLGPDEETVAGAFRVESPTRTELPTAEPSFYTNYGDVDVTAGGGNADLAALDQEGDAPRALYDLVLTTGFVEVTSSGELVPVPSYAFVAGTSFSAPNVAGVAALLFGATGGRGPDEVRGIVEETARPLPVGRAGETTAPDAAANVATDGAFDGDVPSSPGTAPGPFDSETYRGEGHVDVTAALERAAILGDDGSSGGRGRGSED